MNRYRVIEFAELDSTNRFACGRLRELADGDVIQAGIQTAGQITATADYHPGRADRPAILLLHGFLQTRDFGIIKSIADTLADEGYTVLSPTLSLGISNRKRSLDCEALHLHDMDGDVREIQQWVKWLREHGHDDIIGVGHSFGGVQLLAWREKYGINIAYIKRGDNLIYAPNRYTRLLPFDDVGIIATDDQMQKFKPIFEEADSLEINEKRTEDIILQKMVVDENNRLKGLTIRGSGIRERTNGLVVGIERNGDRILNPGSDTTFEWDDIICIVGEREKIKQLNPDLIVSDIMMPVIDGIDLARKIKSETLTSHIPIILLTAKGSEEKQNCF